MLESTVDEATIYLKDYTPPVFGVERVDLNIDIYEEETYVTSTLVVKREHEGDLVLFGRKLKLLEITLNGRPLSFDDYHLDAESLRIDGHKIDDVATICTRVVIYPQNNSELEGLYVAGLGKQKMYVTQCEPEGFRKITFYPDRPDVLSVFTTRIEAPRAYPVLLSNGDLMDKGELDNHRHFAVWHDTTKKPSYLFAAVAADLQVLSDDYVTMDGRKVLLQVYADSKDIDKCHVAMQALKDSMKWDEDNYGRAYDLNRYMIVATAQFNMGAMENKGLNIFNTACVLSDPQTTTDNACFRVKAVIAHEYFHNWTGNRITCRDWFQLCLKEGLTVFRDQSFSADFRSSAVQRIEDVGVLRAAQFTEDASLLAHPVRPDSFVEINNFYTATVYEKGAEIVRMMANLLGKDKYRAGMDEYFARYDGQAVTVEDFIDALATQDDRIYQFLDWYTQPGTPTLSGHYEFDDTTVTIHLSQAVRHVAGYAVPKNLPIPVDVAIFDSKTGQMLASDLLLLTDSKQSFRIDCALDGARPLVSVLRGFSAPVMIDFAYSDDELVQLVQYETDGFNRWQAMQLLINRYLFHKTEDVDLIVNALSQAVDELIEKDAELAARLFDIPSEKELAFGVQNDYDPMLIKNRRDDLRQKIAKGLSLKLDKWYQRLPMQSYEDTPRADGIRALRNVLLMLLTRTDANKANDYAVNQYDNAGCMTERFGALAAMVHGKLASKDMYLKHFYDTYQNEALVIDNWFNVQAWAEDSDMAVIDGLLHHADFDWGTPNRVRAVLGAVLARPVLLWDDSNGGLDKIIDILLYLDNKNSQLAARLAGGLSRWYTLKRHAQVRQKLERLQSATSKNLLEVVNKLLQGEG